MKFIITKICETLLTFTARKPCLVSPTPQYVVIVSHDMSANFNMQTSFLAKTPLIITSIPADDTWYLVHGPFYTVTLLLWVPDAQSIWRLTHWKMAAECWILYYWICAKEDRGRILGRNWDKSLVSCPPCYSQSPLLTDLTQIFGTELGVYNVNLLLCHLPLPDPPAFSLVPTFKESVGWLSS